MTDERDHVNPESERRPRLRVLTHLPPSILGPLEEDFPVELVHIPQDGEIDPGIRGEVLLTQAWGSKNFAQAVSRGVRWVHAYGTGVNAFPFDALEGRILTCSRGVSGSAIAEWAIAVMLAYEKQLPQMWLDGPERWKIVPLGGLEGKSLGILGFGGIGSELAKRALPFGMRVRIHRRTPRPIEMEGVEACSSLEELLSQSDHFVVAAPETRETRRIINAKSLAHAKRGMHFVNVARGGLVDQDALREALDEGTVGFASLDVCTPEPPEAGHWLFHHEKVRLSPHISWSMPGALDGLTAPFRENLAHYLKGEPLEHRVDLELGY